jgi:hypothetical protein
MDTLWKQVKRDALGDRPKKSIEHSAEGAREQILARRPHGHADKRGRCLRRWLLAAVDGPPRPQK